MHRPRAKVCGCRRRCSLLNIQRYRDSPPRRCNRQRRCPPAPHREVPPARAPRVAIGFPGFAAISAATTSHQPFFHHQLFWLLVCLAETLVCLRCRSWQLKVDCANRRQHPGIKREFGQIRSVSPHLIGRSLGKAIPQPRLQIIR